MPEEGSAHGVPMELWREQGGTGTAAGTPAAVQCPGQCLRRSCSEKLF